jgi:hypothetical protein
MKWPSRPTLLFPENGMAVVSLRVTDTSTGTVRKDLGESGRPHSLSQFRGLAVAAGVVSLESNRRVWR